jgi:hypothetical protein
LYEGLFILRTPAHYPHCANWRGAVCLAEWPCDAAAVQDYSTSRALIMGSGATRGGDMLRGAVVAAALVAALLRPAVAGQSVLQTDQTVQTVQAQTVQTAAAPAKPLPPLTVDLPDGSGTLRGGQLADLPTGSFQVNSFLGAVTALCLYSILHLITLPYY